MNLTKTHWPAGWTPSADAVNGDPSGLLRMDNLQQEETGGLGLIRGILSLGAAAADTIVTLHSRARSSVDTILYGVKDGRSVNELNIDGTVPYPANILENGGARPVINDVYGWFYAISGVKKTKYNIGLKFDIGLDTPLLKPLVYGGGGSVADLSHLGAANGWTLDEGHDATINTTGVQAHTDKATLRSSFKLSFSTPVDLMNIGGAGPSSSPENDTLKFSLRLGDSAAFNKLRVEFIANSDTLNPEYYWFEFDLTATNSLVTGVNQWSTLSATRSQFTRQGTNTAFDWTTITAVRFIIQSLNDLDFDLENPMFYGGQQGQLYGAYEYAICYAKNNGQYINKGPLSPISAPVTVLNGYALVTPLETPVDNAEFPTAWIFRRSVPPVSQVWDSQLNQAVDLPVELDQFYKVGEAAPGGSFIDTMSDKDALVLNIVGNQFLQAVKTLPNTICDVIGPYFERVLYLDADTLYLSDRLNPECIDTRYSVKINSSLQNQNLWLKKINNTTLVLGTIREIYQISGTLVDLPDGTLDIFVRPLGEQYPPISFEAAVVDGLVFYTATNGFRTCNGGASQLLSGPLSLLFQGVTRHGFAYFNAYPNAVASYPIAVARNKLYASIKRNDGVRVLVIYDFLSQSWTVQNVAATALCATDSDNVIAAIDNQLYILAPLDSYINIITQQVILWTVMDSNGQPRNRKEPFTLKLVGDTGGMDVDVYVSSTNNAINTDFTFIGKFNSTGINTRYFDLSTLPWGFRYSLFLNGTVRKFKLIEYSIEYDPKPEQLNYLHIANTNLGTTARKRIGQFAFTIDTLGHNVKFTPVVDGISGTPVTFSKSGKLTFTYQFLSETLGIDIGGYLESVDSTQPFEFYGVDLDKSAYDILPGNYDYILLAPQNYGTPNRKAFTSIKFGLDTHGRDVSFTPILDDVTYPSAVMNTTGDRPVTCEYFFPIASFDVTAIDIGAEIKYVDSSEQELGFEFFGPLHLQNLEVFPPRLKTLYIRETNLDIASKKRLRTIPIIINTNSSDVTFTPYLDGVAGVPSTLISGRKNTLFHYFKTDVFCLDLAGFLSSNNNPFEFYSFGKIEDVEVLPVGKKYDQLGPIRIDKIGKLFRVRIRMVATGTSLPIVFYDDTSLDLPGYSGSTYTVTLQTTPNVDRIYELDLPKNLNNALTRIVIGPTDNVFYRYDCLVEAARSGLETDKEWIPIQ